VRTLVLEGVHVKRVEATDVNCGLVEWGHGRGTPEQGAKTPSDRDKSGCHWLTQRKESRTCPLLTGLQKKKRISRRDRGEDEDHKMRPAK
jgi:hypothetical protein